MSAETKRIFVFGSNLAGVHGRGSAAYAVRSTADGFGPLFDSFEQDQEAAELKADSLILANPIAHLGDAASSVEAAREMDVTGARVKHAARALAVVRAIPGATSAELWQGQAIVPGGPTMDLTEFRRRLTDLKEAKQVRQGALRVCQVNGRRMLTWWAA